MPKTPPKRKQVRRDPIDERIARLSKETVAIDDQILENLRKKDEVLERRHKRICELLSIEKDKKKRKQELKLELEREVTNS